MKRIAALLAGLLLVCGSPHAQLIQSKQITPQSVVNTGNYATHAALLTAVTGFVADTLTQAGFAESGDGGAATYTWNDTSYCPLGTSGSPTTADSIVCILPSGQSASTAGRYLLQAGPFIDPRIVGMQPSTPGNLFDNSPYLPALLLAQGPAIGVGYSGMPVHFPAIPGTGAAVWYFSKAIDWTRTGPIVCDRSGTFQTTYLIFAAGVDGIIQDTYNMSPDGSGAAGQDISGCKIQTSGMGTGTVINGSSTINSVFMPSYVLQGGSYVVPPSVWENGDGFFAAPSGWYDAPFSGSLLSVPTGDYVTNVSGSTLTLNQPAALPSTADGYSPFTPGTAWTQAIVRLPVEDVYDVTTAGPVTIAATSTWLTSNNTITVANCTGVTLAAMVLDTSLAGSPQIGTVANCNSGTNILTLALNASKASSGGTDALEFISNIVQMTSGPQTLLLPGDYLDLDAFPFGATVFAAYNTVSNVASSTISSPTLSFSMSSPCPTTIAYPGLILAFTTSAHVIDTTTNTALGYPASCANVGGGSTLTLGSIPPGVTVTSGDAISIPVYSTSQPIASTYGKQTIVVGDRADVARNTFTASVTHTAGSGFMWKLPTGIRRRGGQYAHDNDIGGFVFAMALGGSAGTFPNGGGNTGGAYSNALAGNFIGYISSGDNSGANSFFNNLYGDNHVYDIVEGGTVGSAYFGDNTNSAEAGYGPPYGQVGECGSENFSSFHGMYASVEPYGHYCLPENGTLNAPAFPSAYGGDLLNIGSQVGVATDSESIGPGSLGGPWSFVGVDTSNPVNITGSSQAPGLTTITGLVTPAWWSVGMTITDLDTQALSAVTAAAGTGGGSGTCTFTVNGGFTVGGTAPAQFSTTLSGGGIANPLTVVSNGNYVMGAIANAVAPKSTPTNPATVTGTGGCAGLTGATVTVTYGSAIPSATTITQNVSISSVNISNATQGAGIQTGDPIQVGSSGASPCVQVSGGLLAAPGIAVSLVCGTTGNKLNYTYSGLWGAWVFNGDNSGLLEVLPAANANFQGYLQGGFGLESPVFPHGLAISNSSTTAPGAERLLDGGPTVPTQPWHLQGDCRLNSTTVPGGNLAWCDTPSFTTTLGGNVTKGTTTSVAVAACPTVALAAGTPIIDTTPVVDVEIGTLSTCSGTTLTLQAAAVNNGTSGDTIQFMIWHKVGTVHDTTPVISACGTGTPTMTANSNNLAGGFTMGTGSPTACTITFAHAYPTSSFCTVTPASSGGAAISGGYYLSAIAASGFTLTLGTGTSSLIFTYNCGGT